MASEDTSNGSAFRLQSASRVFRMGEVEVPALVDVDLSVRAGELTTILGPSGSGKSTLLNLLGGMDRPTTGHVWFERRDLSVMTDAELTDYRRTVVGFIFQFYNLVPTLTAQENVQVATELVAGSLDPAAALQLVDLTQRSDHFPAQLSGGEQQRVAIARALAKHPKVILADEPTGALDLPTARRVLAILQDLSRDRKLTVVLITHNPAIAGIADRVVRLVSGKVVETRSNAKPIDAATVTW